MLLLLLQVSMYINGEIPGLVKPVSYNRPIRGLCQRLKVYTTDIYCYSCVAQTACSGVLALSAVLYCCQLAS
jgi:hypothetical protein